MSAEKKAAFILRDAFSLHATDIHILPKTGSSAIYFRISGQLVPRFTLNIDEMDKLVSHLKFQAGMDIGEKRRPQNGAFSIRINGKKVHLRLSTLPSGISESLVIRLLPQEDLFSLRSLSLFPQTAHRLLSLMKTPYGLMVFTGPTGSGKTTTLYSLLNYSSEVLARNVITLEDPIEKRNDRLLQVQVNEKAGITYPVGLKAILRHDPDVIMVGEIRDSETARIAIRAAMTGHLVLTTMHTRDAKGALHRLSEFGVKWHEMEQTIIAVFAQRLVRLNCPFCRNKICSPFCHRNPLSRAAVFEELYGKSLNSALMELKGRPPKKNGATLKQIIAKGIALGFIREEEYERWVYDFAEEMESERPIVFYD